MSLSLRRRILAGYGLVLGLLVVVLVASLVAFARVGRSSETIIRENYRSIRAADGMIDALERQDSGVLLHLLGSAQAERQIRAHQAVFEGWLARAAQTVTIEGEDSLVARIRMAHRAHTAAVELVLNAPVPDASAARPLYYEHLAPAFNDVRRQVDALRDLNQVTMASAADRDRDASRAGVLILGLVGGAALLAGLAFSVLLSTRLAAPVRRLEAAARRLAAGDYDTEVPEGPRDELGRLSTAFNEMADALRTYRALEAERAVQAQRRSAAVIRAIEDGVVLVDAQCVVLEMNPAAAAALSTAPDSARGRPLAEIAPDAPFSRPVDDAAAGRVQDSRDGGFIAGAGREYAAVVTPMVGHSGAPLGALLLLRDVTQLRQLDRLKSEFVATASHELRTPVTSLTMSMGMLQESAAGLLPVRERDLLTSAAEDVARLKALADDLLDLSRIEAGRLELALTVTDPTGLVAEAAAEFAGPASAAGLSLTTDVPRETPAVLADHDRVRRVLSNLIANSIRHTPAGGLVSLRVVPSPPGFILFEVSDTGEGIAPQDQGRIFEPFVQVRGSRATSGSGLGLAIARELVEGHGGRIGVRSSSGEGSTFWFTLPIAVEEPAVEA